MNNYPKVETLSAAQLHERLVDDAVKRIPTPIHWAELAYVRIGNLTKTSAEDAFQAVRADLRNRVGSSYMPMG